MKKTRRVCALVLGITMLFGNVGYAEEECAAEQEAVEIELEASERAASDIAFLEEAFPMREDCSKREERKVERLVERAANDAVLTAEQLNEITDEKIYDVALHEALDKYYGENLEEPLAQFTETVDERAWETLQDYEEAKAERENQANLDYETEEVLLTFESGVTDEEIGEMARRIGSTYEILSDFTIDETLPEEKLKRMRMSGEEEFPKVVLVHLNLDQTVERAEEVMQELESVEDSSKNYNNITGSSFEDEMGSNDPELIMQDYLKQIKVPDAWNSWNESGEEDNYSEAWVAVIDTGLDITHPDLKNRYIKDKSVVISEGVVDWESGDVVSSKIVPMNEANCYVHDVDTKYGRSGDYHGTHVAGIIAAEADNKKGIVGIASVYNKYTGYVDQNCRIMAINAAHREWDEKGKEYVSKFNVADTITAIYYAANNGADVINMSLYGKTSSSCYQKAIDYAHAKNVVVCACAGNGHYKVDENGHFILDEQENIIIEDVNVTNYPAAYNHVISVANVDSSNHRASLSVYNQSVDISAPGVDIYSCVIDGDKYDEDSGTSMATPMVSATAAILRSMYPDTTADEIEEILLTTATDLKPDGKDIYTGHGLLNVGLAVQTLKARRLNKVSPQNAVAKCVDYQSIKLAWDAIDWAERYVVLRSTSANGEYTKIKSIQALDWYTYTSSLGRYRFTDKGLATGTTYYYKIRAASKYKETEFRFSQFCPVISVKCMMDAPTGLTLTPTAGKMKASWAKVNGAEGYQVWRADNKDGTYKRIHTLTSGATVSYEDTTVTAGKTYYYKVRAYRKPNGTAVFSGYSTIVGKKAK